MTRLLHNRWIVFGGIGVIAFFTVFGTCFSSSIGPQSGKNPLAFETATPQPSPTPTPDPNATATPAASVTPTATPIVRRFASPPAPQLDPAKRYQATITTDKGKITIQLASDVAPQAVNSFVFLANNDYYDGLAFQRVTNFFAQGGDAGSGSPGYAIPVEQSGLTHEAGAVALARSNVDNTLTGQFYIVRQRLANQDGKDTVIGMVVEGMDVVNQLTPTNPDQPNAPQGDRIISVTIEEQPAS
ncbi:MAG: peptidylprolyl isomerase [Chloroflexi bacterium]|nr:peptidylprolyl isomerase [Chloroflexota bacterium]